MTKDTVLRRTSDAKLFKVVNLGHWSDIVSVDNDGETDCVKFYGPGYVSDDKGHTYVVLAQ